mgnify:CR=1 FL=1
MDAKQIFGELEKEFGLRGNHILLLEALVKDEYTADSLSKETGIPMGRIYEFLNDLLNWRLVEKQKGHPAVYKVGDLKERILDFLRFQTEESISKEKKLVGLISEEKEVEQTTIVNGREELAFMTMKTTLESKQILSVVKYETIPTILYPFDEAEFIKLRNYFGKKTGDKNAIFKGGVDPARLQLYRTNKEGYANGKKVTYVMDRHSFDHYVNLVKQLGPKKTKEILGAVLHQLETYRNVKVYIVEKNLPISIRIYDNARVLIRIVHLDAPMGIFIQSKKVASFYNSFFEDLFGQAVPASKLMKRILSGK